MSTATPGLEAHPPPPPASELLRALQDPTHPTHLSSSELTAWPRRHPTPLLRGSVCILSPRSGPRAQDPTRTPTPIYGVLSGALKP